MWYKHFIHITAPSFWGAYMLEFHSIRPDMESGRPLRNAAAETFYALEGLPAVVKIVDGAPEGGVESAGSFAVTYTVGRGVCVPCDLLHMSVKEED